MVVLEVVQYQLRLVGRRGLPASLCTYFHVYRIDRNTNAMHTEAQLQLAINQRQGTVLLKITKPQRLINQSFELLTL